MKLFAPLLLAAALLPSLSVADVLLLDAIAENPVNSAEGLQRPSNGQSMDQVRKRYGDPKQEMPWIGDPPISRWIYDDFTVYFEHEYVINSVVHR
ncbi:MAG: hypothetical protein RPU64_15040 [Candidatus Sedimenticola sp. (ex Thyasira tokunagai)]